MSTEIAIYEKFSDPLNAINQLGVVIAKSGMFKCSRQEQGQMLALICFAERKSPVQIMREYHIMEDGQLTPKARNVHAKFLEAGGDIDWKETGDQEGEFDELYAEAHFSFPKKTARLIRFDIKTARKQGLQVDNVKSQWRKNPGAMLRARLITKAVDLYCPSILLGGDEIEADPGAAPERNINLGGGPALPKQATVVASERAKPAAPVAAESDPAKVLDVEVVKEEATPQPAKVITPAPAPSAGQLDHATLSKVETAVGDKALAALKWCKANGKIRDGQTLADISPAFAKQIIERSAAFLRAVETWSAAQ